MHVDLSGYRIAETLHEGMSSLLFRAVREADNQELVVKTINAPYPANRAVAEIEREFRIAEQLKGIDGVVEVYSTETHGNGNLAFTMEYFGTSLDRVAANEGGRLDSIAHFLDIAINIARALGRIHQHGVIHTNLEPQNILVDPASHEIRIVDYGLSCELNTERQDINISTRLPSALAYLSPEQTGRINKHIDFRSDYYALGIVLYEVLTGKRPFEANSTLEWVHCHLSKLPVPPVELREDIPQPISDIVLKLLSKNPEERYQSAFGLIADLERCRAGIVEKGTIGAFELACQDVSEKFRIPQRLYGRDRELAALRQAFDAVSDGAASLYLVSGFSGIGKSALVHELSREIVQSRGYLLQGKFDQVQRNVPYFALKQALRSLVRQLLTEPETRLTRWSDDILRSVGPNGQVLVDLVPELEQIIGRQPAVPDLPATEAQNRFQIVFVKFIRRVATAEHPLVLFLDDLQWCDTPTLNLIQRLVSSDEISHLFLIGAFRSNEVNERHPLALAIAEIEKSRMVSRLELEPLEVEAVSQLVADTFLCEPARSAGLARWLYSKSEGNPFFISEMLNVFHDEGAIWFSSDKGRWEWDEDRIARTEMSGSVVDFVLGNMRKLDARTQDVLKYAACIGNVFDLETLSVVRQVPLHEASEHLMEAIRHNLIMPLSEDYKFIVAEDYRVPRDDATREVNPVYKFQHDRVQQAAYALLDSRQKQEAHLSIGRLIRSHISDDDFEERITDVVRHLNNGSELIADDEERLLLAGLNLRAGMKALGSAAYQAALEYLRKGEELLGRSGWSQHYELQKQLATEIAKCVYLTGKNEESDKRIDELIAKVRTNIEKAEVLSIRTRHCATIGRMEDSIKAAVQGLGLLGIRISSDPSRFTLWREAAMVRVNLGLRKVPDLIDAPPATKPEKLIAIRLLMEIFPAAFLSGSGRLFPYLVLKSVNISLRHGNSPESAFAYAAYGMLLSGSLNKPALGYRYGELAVAMNDSFNDIKLKSRIIYVYTMFIFHWTNHWSSMTPWFRKGIEAGYQSGDLLYLAYSAQDCIIWDPTLDIDTAIAEQEKYLKIVRDTGYQDSYDSGTLFLQMLRNFRGLTDGQFSMNDAGFNEEDCLAGMRERRFMTGIANYHIYKTEIYAFYENYEGALDHIRIQDRMIASSMSLPQLVRYYLMSFITLVAVCRDMDGREQRMTQRRLRRDLRQLQLWADHCPENFLHVLRLMEGEYARLNGRNDEAIRHHLEAIELARRHDFRRDEALANELLGKHYLAISMPRAAEGYLRAARHLYYRLGASRKVEHLEERYREQLSSHGADTGVRARIDDPRDNGEPDSRGSDLDIESIMKASQAISGEIVLDQLLLKIMQILLENAGGQRGLFVLRRDSELFVEAAWAVDGNDSFSSLARTQVSETDSLLPLSLVNFVLRTGDSIVLEDAADDAQFGKDPYIASQQPKSVICVPVQRHSKFEGVLYMENNLTASAFTESRVEVINLLAAQAAISIENAQLYDGLENKVNERTHELSETLKNLKSTQSQLVQSEKMAGLGSLVAGVAHEINNPTNFVHLGATTLEEDLRQFQDLLFDLVGDDNDAEIIEHFREQFDRFTKAISNIKEGTARISTIVKDLRTFSRLDEADKKTVRLAENIDSSLRLVNAQFGKHVDFVCDMDDSIEIDCYPAQLNQVFMNLMINGCQAILDKYGQAAGEDADLVQNPDGNHLGRLAIRLERRGDEVIVAFTDDGVGMSSDIQQRLFEPFFTTKDVGEGTGLGMSISYQIVEGHEGHFEVQSEVGVGSTVTVVLPATVQKA